MERINIISFPKCGRTWLRYFFFRYLSLLTGENIDVESGLALSYFTGKDAALPIFNFTHLGADATKIGHFRPEKLIKYLAGQRTLILFRDPKDVLVSYFFQIKYRDRRNWWGRLDAPLRRRPDNLSDFILTSGITDRFFDFYNALAVRLPSASACRVVHYEEMREKPREAFSGILNFCSLPPVESCLAAALKESDFSAMKKAEERGIAHSILRTEKGAPAEAFKVRRGKIGGYRDYLSTAEIEYIDERARGLAPIFKNKFFYGE